MTQPSPTLPTRALNRALLARQLLLERSELPLTRALEQVGGLQTQYAPSGYVGLWSRLRDFRPLVFNTKTPHSVPTFLVDGAVAGTWRYEKGAVRLEPFDTLASRARRQLEDEAERLASFHGGG